MKFTAYFIATVLCFTLFSCSSDTEAPSPGSTPSTPNEMMMTEENLPDAPDFSLETLSGGNLELSQFEDKVLVIFFFGHNCPPCISAGPTLESDLNQQFRSNDDFVMVGIDVWDGNASQVEVFKDKSTASYPLGLKGSSVMKDFSSARDRLVVVNKEGKIAFSGKSVARNDLSEVKELVNLLL